MDNQDRYNIDIGTSDRVNLAYAWNSVQGVDANDDDYDIPADPPGNERKTSALYAKVGESSWSAFQI